MANTDFPERPITNNIFPFMLKNTIPKAQDTELLDLNAYITNGNPNLIAYKITGFSNYNRIKQGDIVFVEPNIKANTKFLIVYRDVNNRNSITQYDKSIKPLGVVVGFLSKFDTH